jgi:hypothetical protein
MEVKSILPVIASFQIPFINDCVAVAMVRDHAVIGESGSQGNIADPVMMSAVTERAP